MYTYECKRKAIPANMNLNDITDKISTTQNSEDICTINTDINARKEEGRKSVYGIAKKLQETVFVVMSHNSCKKLYAKIKYRQENSAKLTKPARRLQNEM